MKKIFVLVFGLLFILQTMPFANAYTYDTNPLYTIEMPEEFSCVKEDCFVSTGEEDKTFSVAMTPNVEEKFCIADMNDKEVQEYAQTVATQGTKAYKSLGVVGSMDVVSAEKIKHPNGKTALVIVFKTVVKSDGKTKEKYQKICEFSGVDNKFTFTYTSKKNQIKDMDESFLSIVVNETQIESKADKLTSAVLFGGVILVVLLGILRFIKRTPYRNK